MIPDLKFTDWPVKPKTLLDLELERNNKMRRFIKDEPSDRVIYNEEKIFARQDVQEYVQKLQKAISLNYGNYYWLLEIRKEVHPKDPLQQDIDRTLMRYRERYRPAIVPNLPVSVEMAADLKRYTMPEEPEVEHAKKEFEATVISQ